MPVLDGAWIRLTNPVLDRDEGGVALACIGALLDSVRCVWILKDR